MAITKVTGALLGNLSVGTGNVALGNNAGSSILSGGNENVFISGLSTESAIDSKAKQIMEDM